MILKLIKKVWQICLFYRQVKSLGKKEVKTIYKEDNSKITYFVIEEVEEESIVKLIEKMLVNIILTGCNGGLC